MSMEMQRQVRENHLELNEFLKELKGWESTVKDKEKKIHGQGPSKDTKEKIPPRKQAPNSKPNGSDGQETSRNQAEVEKPSVKGSDSPAEAKKEAVATVKPDKLPAAHTYDRIQGKWDKFDVDAALKELDQEEEDGRPVKKAPKREIRPVRGSQGKTSESRRKASAPRPSSPPPEEIFGGKRDPMAATSKGRSSYSYDDSPPNAASEKDLGNDYFKEGKFVRAIDCYSRSIALEPTAVAYANRAMAGIKIRRFEDAEVDCTEAIALDDRYTKAYARRGSARKELKKYLDAIEDLEFALRLEPDNKELHKQYTEVEELYRKEGGRKAPRQTSPLIVKEKEEKVPPKQQPKAEKPTVTFVESPPSPPNSPEVFKDTITESTPNEAVHIDLSSTKPKPTDPSSESPKEPPSEEPKEPPSESRKEPPSDLPKEAPSEPMKEPPSELLKDNLREAPTEPLKGRDAPAKETYFPPSRKDPVPELASNVPIVAVPSKHARARDRKMAEVIAATQAAAARAAANATAAVSRNIVAPRSSYEFELMWKGFDGNKSSQVRLLKITDPQSLPRVFKDSLGAPLLLEIIQSLELLFPEDAELAVQILENLTKVGRFSMTVMFLTSKDKTGLSQLWDQVFMKAPQEMQPRLQHLRSAYRLV